MGMRVEEVISGLSVKIINGLTRNYLNDIEKLSEATDYDLSKIGHDFQTYVELRSKARAYMKYLKQEVSE
jgi:hypothetical protein